MKRILLLITICISSVSFGQTSGTGVTDIDGNFYETVIIGAQEWMAENLRATTYANGDPIPNVTDATQWQNLSTGAWSHYNNDSQNENPYGKLYNWHTVADPRNVCPTGWHVPTDAEWTVLSDYLGGEPVAGGKMKSTGTQYWLIPNTDATNESGFSGLPGGYRDTNGAFGEIGSHSYCWSSTEYDTDVAWLRMLQYAGGHVARGGGNKAFGYSVRCLNDSPISGTIELNPNQPKELIKIVNLLGQEVEYIPNTILIYQYSDGTSEKVFTIED